MDRALASAILSDFIFLIKKENRRNLLEFLFSKKQKNLALIFFSVPESINSAAELKYKGNWIDSLKAAILAHVLGARCHDAPINLIASGLRSKCFVPLNRLLLGRRIMNSAGASEIRPKKLDLGYTAGTEV